MDALTHFPPREVLAPTDLSGISNAALAYARLFRERFGSRITVLHAESLEAPPRDARCRAEGVSARRHDARERDGDRESEPHVGQGPPGDVVAFPLECHSLPPLEGPPLDHLRRPWANRSTAALGIRRRRLAQTGCAQRRGRADSRPSGLSLSDGGQGGVGPSRMAQRTSLAA